MSIEEADARLGTQQATPDDVRKAIDALTPDSSDDEVNDSITLCLEAKLGARALEAALRAISDNSKTGITVVRKLYKCLGMELSTKRRTKSKEAHGLKIFAYHGEYNFDDAVKECFNVLTAEKHESKAPMFSQLGGVPVRLVMKDDRAEFVEMSRDEIWAELCARMAFVRKTESADSVRQKVPEDVARYVHAQAHANLPEAPEIIYAPIYTRNGALIHTDGFHEKPAEGVNHLVILNGLKVPEILDDPTEEEAKESLRFLREELLVDFPFCDTDKDGKDQRGPSEANALAMLLTPFMRRMIAGQAPLFGITKPQEGSGATFLAVTVSKIFEGVEAKIINYTKSEEEMEKKIVSAIREAQTILLFDDVKEFLNRVLLRALTAKYVGGRVLGQSVNLRKPNNFLWIMTGNNPRVGGEMHRRTCWIRLNTKLPPRARRNYHHDNFDSFIETNRGVIIGHVLTLIEYWHSQGAPEFTDRTLASFEEWSRKVGGVLMACGVEGFLDSPAPIILDTETASEDSFLRKMYERKKCENEDSLFEWAEDSGLSIITGKSPDERRRNFAETLRALNGRNFAVENDKYRYTLALRARHGSDGFEFGIETIEEEEIPEEGA